MNILLWVIFGALVGWIASLISAQEESRNVTLDVIVGVIGAFLGGLVTNLFGVGDLSTFNWYSFIISIIGAIVLVALARAVRGSDTTTSRPYRV